MQLGQRLTDEEFRAVGRDLDRLVREFETLPFPAIREMVFDLLQTVDALHREGLSRLVGILLAHDQGGWVNRAAADPAVETLLLLYDLVPGVPSSVADAPAESGVAGTTSFIPLDQIKPARPVRWPVLKEVALLAELPPGTMTDVTVDGMQALLANVAGEVFAVRNACPGSVAPLSLGSFSPPIVTCPWHNEAFDVRTGKRADGVSGPGLEVLPVSVEDGKIKLAIGTRPVAPAGHMP